MVVLGDDIEQVCAKVGEVHLLAAQREGPAHQLVLTIEVDDELAICRRCHRDPVVEPGVHRVPGVDHLVIVEVVDQAQVAAEEVLHGLEHLRPKRE